MADRLKGKRAFVTAAGQGMGRAAAVAFAQEGAAVWATDVNANALKTLEGARGVTTRVLDVTDASAVERIAREAGDVDVLFNCAGFVHHGTIMECTDADWDRSFDINIKSMYRVTRALLPGMLKQGKGSVINMASIASSIRHPEPLRLRHHQGRRARVHQGARGRLREAGHPLQCGVPGDG